MALTACTVVSLAFAIWFLAQRSEHRDFSYRVTHVVAGEDDEHPYGILVAGGGRFSFRRPPGLNVNDEFVARYDRAGQYLGWSASVSARYGIFTAKADQPSQRVFLLPLGVPAVLSIVTIYVAFGGRVDDTE